MIEDATPVEGELSAREELYEIAEQLQEAINREKKAKGEKEILRGPFFQLISEIVREEIPLARQVVEVPNDTEFDAKSWREKNYPEWRIVGIDASPIEELLRITLEENEDFKKYEFTHDGFKYGRTIRMKDAYFDAEGFSKEIDMQQGQAEWNDQRPSGMVEALASCVRKEVVTTYVLDEVKAKKVMAEYPETVALFQKFAHPGRPEPALLPIKVAKEEEE